MTESKLETAACLWEAALEILNRPNTPDGFGLKLQKYREGFGTADLRMKVISLTDECDEAWEKVSDTYTDCFDWDFVPYFLAQKIRQGFLDR